MRNQPPSKVKEKVMIKYTITYWNIVRKILKKTRYGHVWGQMSLEWTSGFFSDWVCIFSYTGCPILKDQKFSIDRTHLGDQGFPMHFFCFGLVFEIIAKNPQFFTICVC